MSLVLFWEGIRKYILLRELDEIYLTQATGGMEGSVFVPRIVSSKSKYNVLMTIFLGKVRFCSDLGSGQ